MKIDRADIEPILRAIVEGQLRCYGQAHPVLVEAVDWGFVPGTRRRNKPKIETFVSSGAKRIVNALLCEDTLARLGSAIAAGEKRNGEHDSRPSAEPD